MKNGKYVFDKLHRVLEGKRGKEKQMRAIQKYIGMIRYTFLKKINNRLIEPEEIGYEEVE